MDSIYTSFNAVVKQVGSAIVNFDRNNKNSVLAEKNTWKLLSYACIPFYGPYLLNFKLDTLVRNIDSPGIPNKVALIDEYHDTSYIFLAAVAIQTFVLSIIPAIILNMHLILAASQAIIGIGLVYYSSQIDSKVKEYQNQHGIV